MEIQLKPFAFILASEHEGKLLFLGCFLEVFNLNSYAFNNPNNFNGAVRLHLTLFQNSSTRNAWNTIPHNVNGTKLLSLLALDSVRSHEMSLK